MLKKPPCEPRPDSRAWAGIGPEADDSAFEIAFDLDTLLAEGGPRGETVADIELEAGYFDDGGSESLPEFDDEPDDDASAWPLADDDEEIFDLSDLAPDEDAAPEGGAQGGLPAQTIILTADAANETLDNQPLSGPGPDEPPSDESDDENYLEIQDFSEVFETRFSGGGGPDEAGELAPATGPDDQESFRELTEELPEVILDPSEYRRPGQLYEDGPSFMAEPAVDLDEVSGLEIDVELGAEPDEAWAAGESAGISPPARPGLRLEPEQALETSFDLAEITGAALIDEVSPGPRSEEPAAPAEAPDEADEPPPAAADLAAFSGPETLETPYVFEYPHSLPSEAHGSPDSFERLSAFSCEESEGIPAAEAAKAALEGPAASRAGEAESPAAGPGLSLEEKNAFYEAYAEKAVLSEPAGETEGTASAPEEPPATGQETPPAGAALSRGGRLDDPAAYEAMAALIGQEVEAAVSRALEKKLNDFLTARLPAVLDQAVDRLIAGLARFRR